MLVRGMRVLAIDADCEAIAGLPAGVSWMCAALVGDPGAQFARLYKSGGPEAYNVMRPMPDAPYCDVRAVTLAKVLADCNVPQADIVKLDIEGSEWGVLEGMQAPLARQISVEFHDFVYYAGQDRTAYYARLHEHLGRWYRVAKALPEVPPWGGDPYRVDCLYVVRPEFDLALGGRAP
jgi:FkbM family methyltransferase